MTSYPPVFDPNLTDPNDHTRVRSTEMSLMYEELSRARSRELEAEAERQRLALRVHRARRLQRRAVRARQRAEHVSARARLALHRAS